MRKLIILLFGIGVLVNTSYAQSLYNLSFNDIDGGIISLSSYEGKRILFFIAPINEADSLRLTELQDFQRVHTDTVIMIGIMSVEDGYSSMNKSAIKNLYQARELAIILTEGMQTKRSAGESQALLLKWLTDKERNSRFNLDAQGSCQKFFISPEGKLNGALPGNISFLDPMVWRMLYKN
jgi:glutathione peroxidase-family protein